MTPEEAFQLAQRINRWGQDRNIYAANQGGQVEVFQSEDENFNGRRSIGTIIDPVSFFWVLYPRKHLLTLHAGPGDTETPGYPDEERPIWRLSVVDHTPLGVAGPLRAAGPLVTVSDMTSFPTARLVFNGRYTLVTIAEYVLDRYRTAPLPPIGEREERRPRRIIIAYTGPGSLGLELYTYLIRSRVADQSPFAWADPVIDLQYEIRGGVPLEIGRAQEVPS